MTYYSEEFFRRRAGSLTASAAASQLRTASKSATGSFDVFLSHSIRDARVILGVRDWLVAQNLRVYVDWIDDPELDRNAVSEATADRLRKRMQCSRRLIYATSRAARQSRWMPWELGYFDGLHDGERVAVMPLESPDSSAFVGEEYLGLYKLIEQVEADGRLRPYAVLPKGTRAEPLRSFIEGANEFVGLMTR
ncbi:toll/interleukin-1 receptor domain-containing protein [Mycobacterium heidelbergense]|uniref:Thoeris protein ThsB TIR-like domain-containing protein n=1 Tax=Mycobacterium heidelbergense TaxID=53376 RepID=A0A1X0DSA0_MYCHE|nr:toll/interleukin-1 receptor domain-containing protein [Mycobacterium heidelbergense]MCV7051905.1 toll/interleukin-1 receptor domain-containing protein [Mycobacterium heidelbergense]ORA75052.1 hypothetical protein BST25_06045 [Mycobacterium heidelbergense]BBZ49100.1 hypothetical protein MHEI_08170 [Mycobacterium heidelbergense]